MTTWAAQSAAHSVGHRRQRRKRHHSNSRASRPGDPTARLFDPTSHKVWNPFHRGMSSIARSEQLTLRDARGPIDSQVLRPQGECPGKHTSTTHWHTPCKMY